MTQPDFKISNEVDLAKALYQFISKQHWLDYERTAQSSASQEGQKCLGGSGSTHIEPANGLAAGRGADNHKMKANSN